jgi:hypothetical protein
MSRIDARARRAVAPPAAPSSGPLVWTFDGPFAVCLADVEDALRRTIVQLDEVSGIAVGLDLSLPALAARVRAGDRLQPTWSAFLARIAQRYGLPCRLRVRHRTDIGPLVTLVIVYRS